MSKRILKRSAKRTPVGTASQLETNHRPGYIRRFVNDVEGRIQRLLDAGYDLVSNKDRPDNKQEAGFALDDGTWTTRNVGGGRQAFLMEIPEELYYEDQDAKEAILKSRTASLMDDLKDTANIKYVGDGITIDSNETKKPTGRPKIINV